MIATVGAALKKIAVMLLTNPKVLKTIGGILLGIIIIIVMPIVAVVSIFNGSIEIDTARLQQMVVENLSAEEQSKLQAVEDTMLALESDMQAAGHTARIKEAQVLYILALSEYADEPNFVSKLVGCFSANQTDEQLIAAVNSAFGTQISADDFQKVMDGIRAVYVDISGYYDPSVKNNLDLVEWAKKAKKSEWGYVYGTYGTVLDNTLLNRKAAQYPREVGSNVEFIRQHWLGRRTADCVGLIKGYGWYDPETQKTVLGSNGMPDVSANGMFANATIKGPISTIPEIPGLAVWHSGHIGIYIGNGQVIQAANTRVGVVQTDIGYNRWTHWLQIPYIAYVERDETE